MCTQNVYDNPIFFEGYKELRNRDDNYNILVEQPAMTRLLPNLKNKTVLDLGCGYGNSCIDFIEKGAKRVLGIDISERMLTVAKSESSHKDIEYLCMNMAELHLLNEKFDLIYSSLAFHYIENFGSLICDVFHHLNDGGQLLFSQEHPIVTATLDGKGHFNKDANGNLISYSFSNYSESGLRNTTWFVENVIKYHRTIGELLTTIAETGFRIEEVVEPVPEEWALQKRPVLAKEFIKPNFLIIKARKQL